MKFTVVPNFNSLICDTNLSPFEFCVDLYTQRSSAAKSKMHIISLFTMLSTMAISIIMGQDEIEHVTINAC